MSNLTYPRDDSMEASDRLKGEIFCLSLSFVVSISRLKENIRIDQDKMVLFVSMDGARGDR